MYFCPLQHGTAFLGLAWACVLTRTGGPPKTPATASSVADAISPQPSWQQRNLSKAHQGSPDVHAPGQAIPVRLVRAASPGPPSLRGKEDPEQTSPAPTSHRVSQQRFRPADPSLKAELPPGPRQPGSQPRPLHLRSRKAAAYAAQKRRHTLSQRDAETHSL